MNLNDEVWTEEQIENLFNVKASSLDNLRIGNGLPYCPVGLGRRVYIAKNVMAWLERRERVNGAVKAPSKERIVVL